MKLDFFKNLDNRMKRLIYILLVFIAGIIMFFIVGKVIIGNSDSYETIELRMKKAAISYYSNNKELLPKEDGNEITIDAAQLMTEGYLKSFEKYNKKKGPDCNGQVFIVNNHGHYLYTPNLSCTDYKTTTLSGKILEQTKVVTEGNGLYQVGDEYVYRGEYVNNYVNFANSVWRILKIDANGFIKLYQEETNLRTSFDNRYNIKTENSYGINDFEVSRAKEELNILYKDEEFLTDNDREKIASKNLCIGKRKGTEKTNDGSLECKVQTKKKYPLGLIQLNEAINPSIDDNCKTPLSESCRNYNYINDTISNSWTLTAYSGNSFETFSIFLPSTDASYRSKFIPVALYLSNRLIYTSGTGTAEDPYVIK